MSRPVPEADGLMQHYMEAGQYLQAREDERTSPIRRRYCLLREHAKKFGGDVEVGLANCDTLYMRHRGEAGDPPRGEAEAQYDVLKIGERNARNETVDYREVVACRREHHFDVGLDAADTQGSAGTENGSTPSSQIGGRRVLYTELAEKVQEGQIAEYGVDWRAVGVAVKFNA
ncbi:hypothetical protein DXG01_003004 [Tephrocybe rancida]|nr:hypothetical protein DXG01_003004 [Tephrocybe rancida]